MKPTLIFGIVALAVAMAADDVSANMVRLGDQAMERQAAAIGSYFKESQSRADLARAPLVLPVGRGSQGSLDEEMFAKINGLRFGGRAALRRGDPIGTPVNHILDGIVKSYFWSAALTGALAGLAAGAVVAAVASNAWWLVIGTGAGAAVGLLVAFLSLLL
ncbi:MAG: hypothetical protein HY401_06410 [Elusimicrobia bacterium]|nr:hypothetical protein [Elusimicrobiota bacterium]